MDPITATIGAVVSGIGSIFTSSGEREAQRDMLRAEQAAQQAAYTQERIAWEHQEEMARLEAQKTAMLLSNVFKIGAVVGGVYIIVTMMKD